MHAHLRDAVKSFGFLGIFHTMTPVEELDRVVLTEQSRLDHPVISVNSDAKHFLGRRQWQG